MKKIRAGMIGLGEIAQRVHLPILSQLSDRYELVGLCDVSPGLRKRMGELYGVTRMYEDHAELSSQPDIDAIFILNSDEYHAECAVEALNRGKHVFIEKPMCFTTREAESIIEARDRSNLQVMVGYMRRFAPAFIQAAAEVKLLDRINYVRVRDIIGPNEFFTEQSGMTLRFDDIPMYMAEERNKRIRQLKKEAAQNWSDDLWQVYRWLLLSLNSHDLSAMRELIGMPKRVLSAKQWGSGKFLHVLFEYDGFCAVLETGVDGQRRFDAQVEVFGSDRTIQLQYDTPYIRQLPTTFSIRENAGEGYREMNSRPTYTDPYTLELIHFSEVVNRQCLPKTTPEDYLQDLELFRMIMDELR